MPLHPTRGRPRVPSIAAILGLLILSCVAPLAAQRGARLLVLTSYGEGRPGIEAILAGFNAALARGGISVEQVFTENLDLERGGGAGFRDGLARMLLEKYAERKIDVVYVLEQPALDFFVQGLQGIAPTAPVIVARAVPAPSSAAPPRRYYMQLVRYDIEATLRHAFELFPDTRHVLFVAGSAPSDREQAAQAEAFMRAERPRVAWEDTSALDLEAMEAKARLHVPDGITLVLPYNRDGSDRTTVQMEVAFKVAAIANTPVFTLWDNAIGRGAIGGAVTNFAQIGQQAGLCALDLIAGGPRSAGVPSILPPVTTSTFDWAQIRRWKGDASALKGACVFINKPVSIWDRYRAIVILATLFGISETFLIAFLLMQLRLRRIAQRRQAKAEEETKKALREKEVLLQEVYHRTKNNMQVIAALLEMQSARQEDPRGRLAMKDMVGRIQSMALVHEKLYQSKDLSHIDLGAYIRDLANYLHAAYIEGRPGVEVELDLEDGVVTLIDTALPCGLVLNELVTNSIKYAFADSRKGKVRIALRKAERGGLRLTVEDDGPGLPEGFDFRRDGHVGLQTVVALIEDQLRGKIELEGGTGTRFVISLAEEIYQARV